MSDIVKATRQYLLSKTAVTDLVGQRISPHVLPQDETLPAIVIEEIDGDSTQHLGGLSGLRQTRVRIKCYADQRQDAGTLREAVHTTGIVGHRGTVGGLFFSGVESAGHGTGADPPTDGGNQWRWYLWTDYQISHSEAT